MNTSGTLIEALANSSLYRDYERAYTEATELPIALRPLETWQLSLHGKCRESSFCALMSGKSRSCAACLRAQDELVQSAREKPGVLNCAFGLCEVAVPVKLGGETIGFLQTGQVLRQKPTTASFKRAVAQGTELGIDLSNAREAYFSTPVATQEKIDSATNLLVIFADHLSMKSNQIVVQTTNAEPPVITKAKQFIAEHHSEDLSLAQVAKFVHTSVFYFCKLFKRSTGVNFTEYVSRIRIEKSKNLLLNRNLRISEIAYEVGFQSLTHFNRTFKNIVGESPTEYRGHLPKSA